MTQGRLIQPYATVFWGENLSAGPESILAQKVSVSLSNESAPSCKFNFLPNPQGFAKFTELKQSAIEQPIIITFGYPLGSSFQQQFQYTGMGLTTGEEPTIEVVGVSLLKGPFTDTRISYTMEEPIALTELPQFLLGKLNPAPKITFKFTPEAQQAAAQVQYLENILQKTPYSILQTALRSRGLRIDPGDSCYNGEVTISVAPGVTPSSTPPQEGGQQPQAGVSRYHILGPGIAKSIKREQKFNIGQSSTKNGASKNTPNSTEQDQEQLDLAPAGSPQPVTAEATTQEGTLGNSNPQPSSESRTEPKPTAEDGKRKAQVDNILTTEVSFKVPMLPNFMGVKPRDFILIPSLAGPGNYIEDWEVETVQYNQDVSGQIMISVKASRPFSGEENLVDGGTLSSAKAKIKALTTAEAWGQYYWQPNQSLSIPFI